MKEAIADSSTLIALLDTDGFDLLFSLFDTLIISKAVYMEITHQDQNRSTVDEYIASGQVICCLVKQDEFLEILLKRLDQGEAESIVLAKNRSRPLLIDEKKGRSIAKSLGIDVVGLIGVIIKLIEKGVITKVLALQIINEVEANEFRLSAGLKALVENY